MTLVVGLLPAAAASAQPFPDDDDPRVGLAPGLTNAEEAAHGVELVAHRDRPPGFYDPGNPGSFAFAQSDLALTETHAFVGSFNGFNIYDITDPTEPQLVTATVCPGGQGDPSIYGDLLFISVEEPRARVDCGSDPGAGERFQGVRIFDVSDLSNPVQVAAVQTCRGSHTHTLVDDPDGESVFVYVSGTAGVRPDGEDIGLTCVTGAEPVEDDARWRIDVIEVPLDAPEDAELVSGPRLFEEGEGEDYRIDGLQQEPPAETHPSGSPWSPQPITDACHDITAYPAIGLAAGACEGNGILIDIADPANPVRVAEVSDPNFAYWHSATFNNDGTSVVFTDEWGGGVGARCRDTDQLNWGANAIFDIDASDDVEMTFASYWKMPAEQTPYENCVAHNGNLLPHPTRDLMVQAWYQGGFSIFDFTDTTDPYEIAYFDRGPIATNDDGGGNPIVVLGGYWSTYWHNGYIYGAEIARGFDVFELTPTDDLTQEEIDVINGHYQRVTNAQLQQPFGVDHLPPVDGCDDIDPVSFPDVSGPPHADNIGCVAAFGIARGFVDGTFGPQQSVRRDQMASFIERLLDVAGVELNDPEEPRFTDIDGNTHQDAIERLGEAGIVQGRSEGVYEPSDDVTRGQMASFIVRALEYALDDDLEAPPAPFVDVPRDDVHATNIDVAYALEIAQGRTETLYVPFDDVLRGQMGSFLARTLEVLNEAGFDLYPIE